MLVYYEQIKEMGGLPAQIRFAVMTRISSKKATDMPDSPENITIFENAFKQLRTELKK